MINALPIYFKNLNIGFQVININFQRFCDAGSVETKKYFILI